MTGNDDDGKKAFQRHIAISAIRLMGAVFIVLALLAFAGKLPLGGEDVAKPVAILLLIVGIADFVVVPLLLSRRWKSTDKA